MFETNFLGCQPTGLIISIFMFISKILSAIRAYDNVNSSKYISLDEESSAIGRRTDVNFTDYMWHGGMGAIYIVTCDIACP